jgi:hypothetical protein
MCPKTDSSDNTELHWQKTPVANLVCHVPSSKYYARIRVHGKLIWKSSYLFLSSISMDLTQPSSSATNDE